MEHRPATPVAQEQYAEAIAHLTQQVDAVRAQPSVSEDKKNAAEDIVDAVHLKHSAVLEQLGQQRGSSDKNDKQDIEKAKDESEKPHASDRPARTAEPSGQPGTRVAPQPTKTAARVARGGRPVGTAVSHTGPTRTGSGQEGSTITLESPAGVADEETHRRHRTK